MRLGGWGDGVICQINFSVSQRSKRPHLLFTRAQFSIFYFGPVESSGFNGSLYM